jgi:hypothetical protein
MEFAQFHIPYMWDPSGTKILECTYAHNATWDVCINQSSDDFQNIIIALPAIASRAVSRLARDFQEANSFPHLIHFVS